MALTFLFPALFIIQQILKRDKGMDKKVKKAAVKEKKEEIKAIKDQKKGLAQQFKDAKKAMTGIIMTNYLKKKKKESIKVQGGNAP